MFKQYETSKYGGYSHKLVKNINEKPEFNLQMNSEKTYQSVVGFGGAFTEASAYTLSKMSKENRDKVLDLYFNSETGLRYNLGRVAIHSCDFALENYTYVEENDVELKTFNIERDFKWVIPMIKDAEMIRNASIEILASPWSPPAWMKTNNEMNHGGSLKPEFFQPWANYYIKFINAYENAGINIFGLTVQNEPAAKQVWDSCIYTAEEERDFVKNYLGPTLHKSGHEDKKLIIWDHNRDILVERASTVLSDIEASKYVWGTGVHWYVSEAFENLTKVKELFPDKHLLFTEGCIEGGVRLGSFETGERYARNMIGDFSNFLEGFIDWNLVLNEIGGPNHVGNYCDAPIICDTKNDVVHVNSTYYAIGHFSKYVDVGALRIDTDLDHAHIKQVAFKNPNGSIIMIFQNESEKDAIIAIPYKNDKQSVKISRRSLSTIIIKEDV
ncbi:glycoside hydrolase family 30 protein [Liberiplasma polymorphum]|uniref:glycoside hydrolase family 30 protein n=1 Tax=Liberiplasma polymorphum TaxID=3374570 RepID=UPI003772593C